MARAHMLILAAAAVASMMMTQASAALVGWLAGGADPGRLLVGVASAPRLPVMPQTLVWIITGTGCLVLAGSVVAGAELSAPLKRAVDRLRRLLPTRRVIVTLTGPSGAGKSWVVMHAASGMPTTNKIPDPPRVVHVNCGAIPDDLFESILFGHVKGAFSGAIRDALGRVREAGIGLLFLDEVGEVPLHLQPKLLRLLCERRFRPVGAQEDEEARCMIVCATNRDLVAMVEAGTFREDLYWRIASAPAYVPPLRDPARRKEITPLARAFASRHGVDLDDDTCAKLTRHDWPGNVRQLEATIDACCATGVWDAAMLDEQLDIPRPMTAVDHRSTDWSTNRSTGHGETGKSARQAVVQGELALAEGPVDQSVDRPFCRPENDDDDLAARTPDERTAVLIARIEPEVAGQGWRFTRSEWEEHCRRSRSTTGYDLRYACDEGYVLRVGKGVNTAYILTPTGRALAADAVAAAGRAS